MLSNAGQPFCQCIASNVRHNQVKLSVGRHSNLFCVNDAGVVYLGHRFFRRPEILHHVAIGRKGTRQHFQGPGALAILKGSTVNVARAAPCNVCLNPVRAKVSAYNRRSPVNAFPILDRNHALQRLDHPFRDSGYRHKIGHG